MICQTLPSVYGALLVVVEVLVVLVELLALAGLSEVLPVRCASSVEMNRQAEQREEALVDEEVEPGDAPA